MSGATRSSHSAGGGSVSDATSGAKGVVQLAGDLTGSAAAPSVVGSLKTRAGNRVFFIGDSITDYQLARSDSDIAQPGGTSFAPLQSARSYAAIAMMLSEGRLVYAGQSATAGYTTAQVLATHVPVAVAAAPTICHVLAGRNDIAVSLGAGASQATIDAQFLTSIANYKSIFATLLAAGILPAVCTLSAANGNDAGQRQLTARLNAWLRRYAWTNSLPLVDYATATTDPATGGWITGYNFDNSHPKPLGARAMGAELNAKLTPFLRPYKPPYAYYQSDPADKGNLMPNPLFITDTNTDGLPDNWTATGTATKNFTQVAASGGDALGTWMHMGRTGGTGSALVYSDKIAVTPGDRIAFAFRFRDSTIESVPASVAVRLVGLAASGDNPTSAVIQYVAGITSWYGDQATPGLFYQENVIAAGVNFVAVVLSVAAGTASSIDVSQMSVFNLTAMGALA